MQKIAIKSACREKRGKGPARRLRMAGQVPAVLYSKGTSTLLTLNPKEIDNLLKSASGENSLITLQAEKESEKEARLAILKQLQRDPITGKILHADLFEISIDKPLTLRIPVEIFGVSVGVKNGGILQHNLRELEIRCLPSLIPDHIRVDVSLLKIGEVIHVKDVAVLEGIEMIADSNLVVVSVVAPISEAKLEAMLATAPKETKAPEVIGAKEKEEEAPTAGGKEKGKEEPKAKGKEVAKK
ncbi:MAG: 50S ribosomal protein L25 [Nitrospirae bacterium]|nr:50S ribosomal protein L25 [Candidatus Troglogloeales bacterium]MBI3597965.1 50S ribosomal protein L25 [Candidatus Troglogloeales bacterium]